MNGLISEAHEFYRAMGYDNEKMQVRFLKNLGCGFSAARND